MHERGYELMGEELNVGARIAIGLIILGVILASVFVILGFTRGTTNEALTNVQNSMSQLSQAQYDDYDQKIVSGTQVLSALKMYQGNPVAIVTRTNLQEQAAANTGFNYGALLNGTDNVNFVTQPLSKATGNSWYIVNLAGNGTLTYNLVTLPTLQTGGNQYILPTAKFLAELIKDSTGSIVGICFTQQT